MDISAKAESDASRYVTDWQQDQRVLALLYCHSPAGYGALRSLLDFNPAVSLDRLMSEGKVVSKQVGEVMVYWIDRQHGRMTMGMYDTVIFRCHGCGAENHEQTKNGDCTLSEYRAGEAIPDAIANSLDGCETSCVGCGAKIMLGTVHLVTLSVVAYPGKVRSGG